MVALSSTTASSTPASSSRGEAWMEVPSYEPWRWCGPSSFPLLSPPTWPAAMAAARTGPWRRSSPAERRCPLAAPPRLRAARRSPSAPPAGGARGGSVLCPSPLSPRCPPPLLASRAEELRLPARAWGGASLTCPLRAAPPLLRALVHLRDGDGEARGRRHLARGGRPRRTRARPASEASDPLPAPSLVAAARLRAHPGDGGAHPPCSGGRRPRERRRAAASETTAAGSDGSSNMGPASSSSAAAAGWSGGGGMLSRGGAQQWGATVAGGARATVADSARPGSRHI